MPAAAPGQHGGIYGGWGDVTRDSKGRFYFSIGNHMSYNGGNADIFRYDPATKTQEVVLRTKDVCAWGPGGFADGKLHGDLVVAPNGEMWALSYFGPIPTQKDFDSGYRGGHLIHFNTVTGEAQDMGVPLEGEGWPYHYWDWKRGMLFGVGHFGNILVYDTNARKVHYAGAPPNHIDWADRACLIDPETGIVYSSDARELAEDRDPAKRDRPCHLLSYRRANNDFRRLDPIVPRNPFLGHYSALRAYTKRRDPNGAFWCNDNLGTMFRFLPSEQKVELVGTNWGKAGKYMTNICLSPDGRYLYYVPGADTRAWTYGLPVVQYDIQRNRKKVLAFLYDFYVDKYGYGAGGTYGFDLDAKGESIFFHANGRFTAPGKGTTYGRPSIFHVHIPAAERPA